MEKEILYYKSLGKVFCPYLEKEVSFNSKGLNHLKFNGQGKARTKIEREMRISLLKYIDKIIDRSHTLQGVLIEKREEKIRTENVTKIQITKITFYEFMAIIDNKRIKVILKQLGEGNIFFWSVIPYWKKINGKRKINSIEKTEL